jgi:hypothetical protein
MGYFLGYGVSARDVPQRLKPGGFISLTAGLKTCSTPPWNTVKYKKGIKPQSIKCLYGTAEARALIQPAPQN